jgi:hypothetical protein
MPPPTTEDVYESEHDKSQIAKSKDSRMTADHFICEKRQQYHCVLPPKSPETYKNYWISTACRSPPTTLFFQPTYQHIYFTKMKLIKYNEHIYLGFTPRTTEYFAELR